MKSEKIITVYLTEKEYAQVKHDADSKHMTLTGYIRFLLMNSANKSIGELLCTK